MIEQEHQYIEFKLGRDSYAMGMEHVREIIKVLPTTKLIGAPDFVIGISKVREEVITIIDLRQKFNIDTSTELDEGAPRIIILDNRQDKIGIYVDDVVEIVTTPYIEHLSTVVQHGIIHEIIKLETSLIPVLDIDKLFLKDTITWLNK